MATTLPSDVKVYDELFNSNLYETLQKELNVFNEASSGAIRLIPRMVQGYVEKQAFFPKIANLVSRRDITSVAAATALKMTQAENIKPKVYRKVGPIDNTKQFWKSIGKSWEEIAFILGGMSAPEIVNAYVETAISSLVGQFKAAAVLADVVVDRTGTPATTMVSLDINAAMAKLGDKAARVKVIVMHSKQYRDLIGDQITNYKFDMVSGYALYQGSPITASKPVLVVDSESLIVPATSSVAAKYYALFLTEDACHIEQSEETSTTWDEITGLENLVDRFQSEFAYSVGVKGVSFTGTTPNPTDAALLTGTNWTKTATSFKDLAGVALITF